MRVLPPCVNPNRSGDKRNRFFKEAVVLSSPKTAALYFERIFPVPARLEHITELEELVDLGSAKAKGILDADIANEVMDLVQALRVGAIAEQRGQFQPRLVSEDGYKWTSSLERAVYDTVVTCNACEKKELVLSEIPELLIDKIEAAERESDSLSSSIYFRFANLDLVDASDAPWEQILQFREDPEARAAFSYLRNFIFTDCSGYTFEQLQDKFSTLLDEYDVKREEHGFKAFKAGMDVVLNSPGFKKYASGWLTALLGSCLGSASVFDAGLALGGASIVYDCARGAIAAKERLIERRNYLRQHPANWVFLARNRLAAPSGQAM